MYFITNWRDNPENKGALADKIILMRSTMDRKSSSASLCSPLTQKEEKGMTEDETVGWHH